ncbi:hypothetical protein PG993_013724 [Apiospora rasikravindrae]|uniref:Uncharacterized protein n=1 Tax=Apiospora rasikravindrae TaxID=990691 RepID=A0ABR1RR01_9PEZI
MGNSPSYHTGRLIPQSGDTCYAPDPASHLTLALDRPAASGPPTATCSPNRGGAYSAYVTYTNASDGALVQRLGSTANPAVIPDAWAGLLPFEFDLPYAHIRPDSEVEMTLDWVSPKKSLQVGSRSHKFLYKAAGKPKRTTGALNATSGEDVVVMVGHKGKNAYLNCQL